MNDLVFIKWGGSLITNKNQPMTPRKKIIQELSNELANIIRYHEDTKFILGHGSGSFGHSVAKSYDTRSGVSSPEQWHGFSNVWHAAHELNNMVMNSLFEAGISSLAFPPSSTFLTKKGEGMTLPPLQCLPIRTRTKCEKILSLKRPRHLPMQLFI